MYSKRCNIPKSLHIATSDISQGQNWCCVLKKVQYRQCLCICVFKKMQYRLSLCILPHPIYHKNKTGVLISKRCNIAYVFAYVYSKLCNIAQVVAYCCIWYITRTNPALCIQNGAILPCVFAYCCIWYITRTKLVLFKTMQYRLCIWCNT